jgi:hypothetical protein
MLFGSRGAAAVGAMLGLQLVILCFSLGPLLEISAFCSGTAGDRLASIFGGVHVLLLFLLVVGVCSFRFTRLRRFACTCCSLWQLPGARHAH